MDRAQKSIGELDVDARALAIAAWIEEVAGELAGETNPASLADQLAEWAWIEWRREDPDRARALLAVSTELMGAKGANVSRALAGVRVEALFGPFLESMKNVDAMKVAENDEK